MNVQEQVHELLAPIVATLSVELYDVEFSGSTLRVLVQDPAGAITTDRLAQVNRLISPILDQHDPIPGRYTLEVSSPGLERPLKRAAHLQRAVGEEVLVKMVPAIRPRRYKGRLAAFEPAAAPNPSAEGVEPERAATEPAMGGTTLLDGEIVVEAAEIDGVPAAEPTAHRLSLASVASVRTVFSWGPGPKPGASKAGASKAGASKAGASKPSQARSAKARASQPDKTQPGSPEESRPMPEVSDEQ
ncbi:MAG: ribosome maturation factor RimP [Acidimicrobiia bacterium]|nr:ribosome maturation factor RimP [Acidimicrobiia bacterium]